MVYYNYRYYNCIDARWISQDPVGEHRVESLYCYTRNTPAFFDVLGLEWQLYKDKSGNIDRNKYVACSDSDTLQNLAQLITGEPSDWECIWPEKIKRSSDYPKKVRKGDIYDIRSLYPPTNELVLVLHELLYVERYKNIFLHMKLMTSGDVTEKIKESSGEGKTPITYMLIASHHSGRRKEFVGSGATNFDVAGFVRQHKNIAPTYNRAKNKKGPLKCWFARYSFIYFSGCNTQSSAKLFSEEVLRTGSTIYGTNCSVVTGATKTKTKY